MWTIVTTLESALVVAGVGLAVDFLRNLGPRLIFAVTSTIPVRIADKSGSVGAYELKVRNDSRKKAEDITLYLRAGSASLRIEDYTAPAGLKFVPETDDEGIKIPLAYLKPADVLRLLVVAEGAYVPGSLGVTVSSPNKISSKSVADVERRRPFLRFTLSAFFGIFAVLLIFYAGRTSQLIESTTPQKLELNRRQIMVSAAADSELPNLALSLAATDDPTYYEGGDLAFSLAATSSKVEEIEKYRQFLSLTLGRAIEMAPESQANLFFSLGRIDLLLSDENSASDDLKSSIAKSRSTIEFRLKSDPKIREFLARKGLM